MHVQLLFLVHRAVNAIQTRPYSFQTLLLFQAPRQSCGHVLCVFCGLGASQCALVPGSSSLDTCCTFFLCVEVPVLI